MFLKLGQKHCFSLFLQQPAGAYARRAHAIRRRIAASLRVPWGPSRLIPVPLVGRIVAILVALPPLHICAPPRVLHALLCVHGLVAINQLVRGALLSGRRAHSSVSFVRPGGSAQRRSIESPSSGARLIGCDWAGRRAYHREGAPPAETCARGNVWRHRCALEGLALRLRRPMQWRSRSQRRRGGARSPPRARRGARGLPGRAHPSWADFPPCTPSISAGWVAAFNSRKCVG